MQICYRVITEELPMGVTKRPYKTPRLVRAGSFEELTRAAHNWDKLIIFGMSGGAAGLDAHS
jgi:hypothetical protein